MMLPMYLRIAIILAVLVVGYCLWDDFVRSPEEMTGSTAMPLMQISPVRAMPSDALPEQRLVAPDIDLFPDQRIPPAAVPEPVPFERLPLPARPPPLPYQVSGVWVDGQQHKIILNDGSNNVILCRRCDQSSSLTEGDLLDGQYRIDKIDNEKITLTYLPLQIQQVIRLDKAMAETGT